MLRKKKTNKIFAILLIVAYCVPASYVTFSHSHEQHHEHSHGHVLYCDNFYEGIDPETGCTHAEHLIDAEEECLTCDYLSNCDPIFLFEQKNQQLKFFSQLNKQSFNFLYSDKRSALKNKSPPFII